MAGRWSEDWLLRKPKIQCKTNSPKLYKKHNIHRNPKKYWDRVNILTCPENTTEEHEYTIQPHMWSQISAIAEYAIERISKPLHVSYGWIQWLCSNFLLLEIQQSPENFLFFRYCHFCWRLLCVFYSLKKRIGSAYPNYHIFVRATYFIDSFRIASRFLILLD